MGGFGGRGIGRILAEIAAALGVRLITGVGPSMASEDEEEDEEFPAEDPADEEFPAEDPAAKESPSEYSFKVTPVTTRWSGINCFLSDKRGKTVRFLLRNVSGEAKPGRLLAIVGPMGSGKTTLLNVLAGQLVASPHLHLSGQLDFYGPPSSSGGYKIAYVRQEDLFFSQLTVRETLSLAAELQSPEMLTAEKRDEYVKKLIFRLGLVNCADSIVGDAKVRGISGGEKKRLSLACELIANPSVILADEPITGLDAFQSQRVMETLRQLAQDGHTVICSIHKPIGSVYSKLDDIILLSDGAIVYMGPAKDEPLAYLAKFGYQCPDHENSAEFLADLISIDYSSTESVHSPWKRIVELLEASSNSCRIIQCVSPVKACKDSKVLAKFAQKSIVKRRGGWWRPFWLLLKQAWVQYPQCVNACKDSKDPAKLAQKSIVKRRGGWWRQFWLLLKRAWMQASRDGPTNKVWATMTIASAIIFGSVFRCMRKTQASIQDRMRLLQVTTINTAISALIKTIGVFPKERAIVDRERAKGSYSLAPYLLSKLLAEIPIGASLPLMFGSVLYPMARLCPNLYRFAKFCGILTMESFAASAMGLTVGAMVPTTEAAMAVGSSLMTVFIVYGGYFVNAENTPVIFRWIPQASLIRWAFQGLCVNEFRGLQFEQQNSFDIQSGEQALERLSFGGTLVKDTMVAQGRILTFWSCTTYLLLQKNKPKYQQLDNSSTTEAT